MNGVPLLLYKNLLAGRHHLGEVARQSLLKNVFILLFTGGLLAGLWNLFLYGFRFLDRLGGAGLLLLDRLFSLFFFGLAFLIAFSGFITAVAYLYRSAENDYLMTRPLGLDQVILYKYFNTIGLSSWAYFFVVIPFVGAYAQAERISPLFPVWTFVLSIPFVFVCGGVGFLVCLLLSRLIPKRRIPAAIVVPALLAIAVVIVKSWPKPQSTNDDASLLSIAQMIPGITTASGPWWPSQWISDGILSLSRGRYDRGLMLFLCLLSNALLIGWLIARTGRTVYYETLQRVAVYPRRIVRRRREGAWLERLFGFLPRDIGALCVKDLRMFFRDPAQWTQGLIFFGLLGFYFFNLRLFRYHTLEPVWRNLIAFLNIFSVSAVMCSYGSRFLYPQLSLEGQAFWFLGVSPVSRRRILLTKFGVATVTLLAIAGGLIVLSTQRLNLDLPLRTAMITASCSLALAIAGLSTGLGAVFMDLRRTNPAAIVSSFGGTLNLILSLAAMILVTIPVGMFFHMHYTGALPDALFQRYWTALMAYLGVVGLLFALLPVWFGLRHLDRREF